MAHSVNYAKRFVCPTCSFRASGPIQLGQHYDEFPAHKIDRDALRRAAKKHPGAGYKPPVPRKPSLRKQAAADVVRAIAMQADGNDEDFAAGLSKLLHEPNNDRLALYLQYIFKPVMEKLVPPTMGDDQKEIKLKEIDARMAAAQDVANTGGVHITLPVIAAPDGSQPALPQKTVSTADGEDIIEAEPIAPMEPYDDDFD